MSSASEVVDQIQDLINELESIQYDIDQHGLLDESREELQNQAGTVTTILEEWG